MKKLIIGILLASQLTYPLSGAQAGKLPRELTKVDKKALLEGLSQRKQAFQKFYAKELDWIGKGVAPLVRAIVQSHKKLESYRIELATWEDIEVLAKRQDQAFKFRAEQISKEIDFDFALLFVSVHILNGVSKKHQDQIKPFFNFVGEIGARYLELDTKLKLILAAYHRYSPAGRREAHFSEAQKKLEEVKNKKRELSLKIAKVDIDRIRMLVDKSNEFESRVLWLSALSGYERLKSNPEALAYFASELQELQKTIIGREVTVEAAKENLWQRLLSIKLDAKPGDERRIVELTDFFINPYPDRRAFYEAEQSLIKLEMESRETSKWNCDSGLMLCSAESVVEGWGELQPKESQTTTTVYTEKSMVDGKEVINAVFESYYQHGSGATEKSTHKTEMTADVERRIREHFGAGPKDPINFKEVSRKHDDLAGEGGLGGGEVGPRMPSHSSRQRTENKVSKYSKDGESHVDVTLADPIRVEPTQDYSNQIYSGTRNDRADVHNSATDLASKVDSDEVKAKAKNVSETIKQGEQNLRQAFKSLVDHMQSELTGNNAPVLPEASNVGRPEANEASIKDSLKSTKMVLDILSKKNVEKPHADQAMVQRGLDSASALVEAAEKALKSGDLQSAESLLAMAHELIAKYGPTALRIAVGFSPAGDMVDLVELLTGKDALNGNTLSNSDRYLAALALIVGSRGAWSKVASHFESSSGKEISELLKSIGEHYNEGKKLISDLVQNGNEVSVLGKVAHLDDVLERSYESLAKETGANYFKIDPTTWDAMTESARWELNKKFLDESIERGREFVLSANPNAKGVREGFFKKELDYLVNEKGYKVSENGLRLLK